MAKGLDKGAAQLRIEGQCREMNFGGAYAELAAEAGIHWPAWPTMGTQPYPPRRR